MVEKVVYSRLSSCTPITNLTQDRIYYQNLPEGSPSPAISFSRISTSRNDIAHSGAMGLPKALVQISIYSLNSEDNAIIAKEIRQLFHGWKGTVAGIEVLLCRVIQDRDLQYELVPDVFHRMMEILMPYRE